MMMKIGISCSMFLWLSCAPFAVNGQPMDSGASVAANQREGATFPIAQIEPIPAASSGKSFVNAKDSTVEFEIYFGGSACDEPNYTFEKISDSLHLVQEHGQCYRHGKRYGIKGAVKGLATGKYILAVIRRFRKDSENGNPPLAVYLKEVQVH
jgi:hypothetical protein